MHQDERSHDLFVLLCGRAGVQLFNRDGREVLLDVLREGDVFGEMSFFDKKPRSATVTALTDVKMLVLTREVFLSILRDNPEITIGLVSVMARRLRKADETIETLTFLDVAGRVAKLLVDTARESGVGTDGGALRIKCPPHKVIANQIGSSREAVTKAIRALEARGMIQAAGKEITIAQEQLGAL